MYSDQQIFERIRLTLTELFEIPPAKITLDAHLADDLDIDSIDAVDLIAEMRDLVNRKIEPEEFKSVRTLRDVVQVLQRLTSEA